MHQKYLTFAILIFVSFIFSADVRADTVDGLVNERLKERHIPGAAIAVIKDGRVVKRKGYGIASLEFGTPATTDTAFEIGSVSKQMTAAAIMLLVEDGKVFLDAKISDYLTNTPNSWKAVTVRHLLTHSSGIKSYSSLDGFELANRHTAKEFVEKLGSHPLEFVPGEKTKYNNSGFNLLAYIIEAVSGQPFMDFMRSRIFLPLGMKSTTMRDPEYIIPNRAGGYEWRGKRFAGRDGNLTNLMGAGSIVSTITDMIKWNAALDHDEFLSAQSKAEMWKRFVLNDGTETQYGLGWRISDVRGHKLISHTGQTAGFGAAIFRYVDDRVSVIVLTNLGELGMGGMLAAAIAKKYIPEISLKKITAISDKDPKRTKKILAAITARIANEPVADSMTESLFKSLTARRAKRENDRIAAFGPIKKFDLVGAENIDNKWTYTYRANTEERIFLWSVTTDAAGTISGMSLDEEE